MSNMSYCRFENTSNDLDDCFEHLHDSDLSNWENEARERLINRCIDVIEDLGGEVNLDPEIISQLNTEVSDEE